MQEQETGCGCGTPDRQSLELSAAPASALGGDASPAPNDAPLTHTAERHRIEQAHVPGGEFTMGDATGHRNRGDGETPLHRVAISALDVDVTTVTNADFARFVEDTGYRTEAERYGFSAVFHLALAVEEADVMGPPPAPRGGGASAAPTGAIPAVAAPTSTVSTTIPSCT